MRAIAAFALLVLIGVASGVDAQQSTPAALPPTVDELRAAQNNLPEDATEARQRYSEAIARLERARASRAAATASREGTAAAQARLETIRDELSRPPTPALIEPAPNAKLADLEAGEASATAALRAARDAEAQLQTEATRRAERREAIQDGLDQRRRDLAALDQRLATPSGDGSDAALAAARRADQLAQRWELAASIDELEAEQSLYDAERDLLPARRDLAARRVTEAEAVVAAWRSAVADRRRTDAEAAAREAARLQREAARRDPVLQAYAAETQQLAQQRTDPEGIPARIERATDTLTEVRTSFTDLRRRYQLVRQRIDVSGLDRATGLMLRREYVTLPDTAVLQAGKIEARRELEETEFLLFERRDARSGSDDINAAREALLGQVGTVNATSPELTAVATELVSARRDVLAALENDADRYRDILLDLTVEIAALDEAASAYAVFIGERILWVRSLSDDRAGLMTDLNAATAWFTDPEGWTRLADRTREDTARRLSAGAGAVTIIAGLFALGLWSRGHVARLGELVGRYRTDRFAHTALALVLTTAMALPWAVLPWFAGRLLARPDGPIAAPTAIGEGLIAAAKLTFVLSFARHALRSNGLFDAHFRWSDNATGVLRRQLRWFAPLFITCSAVIVASEASGQEPAVASIARIALTAGMLAAVVFIQRTLRPRGRVLADLAGLREGGWPDRLRYLWFPPLLLSPLALAVVAWLGYFYTASQLLQRVESTIALLLLVLLVNGVLLRWLFVARRRVAVEDARRRREQIVTADTDSRDPSSGGPTESSLPPLDEDKVDLPAISLQSRQLFRITVWLLAGVGLYAIWADALPALRMLDRVEIYPQQRLIAVDEISTIPLLEHTRDTATTPSQPGAPAPDRAPDAVDPLGVPLPGLGLPVEDATSEPAEPLVITLSDVGAAIIVLFATILAFRNLPGLIEIMVLQRLPLDAGARYALSTVLRYLIALIGIAAASNAIDISWSSIQWLAAALTFGLAFGLQEIFANFISGLIILAERPIRIGDTVTVGNVTGTVTRIRMRATTIMDWDRKELLIPNKTFITGDVINWTLSDPVLRVSVPVGLGYAEDLRKAERTLLDVAARTSNVLADPKAYVVATAFADSSINMELRVFVPHIDHMLTVRHELHMGITDAFRAANLEIAFPQRDLHIRSADDVDLLSQRLSE